MKASELMVRCLENEQVQFIFGIPGEENIDVMDALLDSSIRFIGVRHEQGGAFMADVYGRLSARAGVCLATLGPGRHQPDHRRRRRQHGRSPGGGDHRPDVARPHAQGVAPAHRRGADVPPGHQVERPDQDRAHRPRRSCARRSRWRRPRNPAPPTSTSPRMWPRRRWLAPRCCRRRRRAPNRPRRRSPPPPKSSPRPGRRSSCPATAWCGRTPPPR